MSIYRPSNEARNDDRLEIRKQNDLSVPDIKAIIMEDLFWICGYTTNEDDTSFDHEIVEPGHARQKNLDTLDKRNGSRSHSADKAIQCPLGMGFFL